MELMSVDDGRGANRSYLPRKLQIRARNGDEESYRPLVGIGPKALRSIGKYLKDHNATVTAFYLSNVEQYLYSDGKLLDFYNNVATLPMNTSTFVRTFGPNGEEPASVQGRA
jgi:hypothetical protein